MNTYIKIYYTENGFTIKMKGFEKGKKVVKRINYDDWNEVMAFLKSNKFKD